MASGLEEQLAAFTLDGGGSPSRSPSPVSSLSSSSGSTEYFSDEGSRPSSPVRGAPTPPPPALVSSTQRLYSYGSPDNQALTQEWAKAAHATVGIPNTVAHRLTPRRRKNTSIKAYAVFFGRTPGWCTTWAEVQASTLGVRGALYQGYPTPSAAEAAYEYARSHFWIGVRSESRNSPIPCAHLLPIQLPAPLTEPETTINSLHCGTWYVVYKGIAPGVYQSFLECGINTVGISGATYDSFDSRDIATERFTKARIAGETMSYPIPRIL
ncbi:hypothetical protein DFH06DRAFT_1341734 [Mycena polygramma]|nr:hypothetical protein DFH06DRAFT_1341734 [Mycena polygramma]